MKAKDTMIDIDAYLDEMGWVISRDGLQYAWLKQALKRQAEISFKAGYEKAETKYDNDYMEIVKEEGKRAGIKEVVEDVNKMVVGLEAICLPSEQRLMNELQWQWQALRQKEERND